MHRDQRLATVGKFEQPTACQMPMPGAVEPIPLPSLESRFSVPLEAQDASYFAASARISNFRCKPKEPCCSFG